MKTEAFIRSNTQLISPPAVPEIRLHLATEVTPLWQASEDYLKSHNMPPPYWAFPWVGGQALTRYVLDNPGLVRGKTVLDFAAGSGMTAIAAGMRGAKSVEAAEIDAIAVEAIRMNAAVNGVMLSVRQTNVLAAPTCPWEVVLAGDVCYEKPMADAVFAWLRRCAASGAEVLMADPGRAYLPPTGLMKVASYTIPCSLELEDRTSRTASIYKIVG